MPARLLMLNISDLKVAGGGVVAIGTMLADAVSQAPMASWESFGIKTLLMVAVCFLFRELQGQRKAATEEAKQREEKLIQVLEDNTRAKDANTTAMLELKHATETQTGYYKTVAQTLLNREINPKLPG